MRPRTERGYFENALYEETEKKRKESFFTLTDSQCVTHLSGSHLRRAVVLPSRLHFIFIWQGEAEGSETRTKLMEGNTFKQLVFEDYLKLYRNLSADNLTFAHTNQAKTVDAVKFLLQSPPVRSTIRTNIVPLVFLCTQSLELEEIRQDLQTIGWEESTVQSVATVETAVPAVSCCSTGTELVTEKNGMKVMAEESVSMYPIPSVDLQTTVGNTEQEEVTREFNKSRRLPEHRTIRVSAKNAKDDDKYSWQKYDSRKRVDHLYRQRYYKCRETGCHAKKVIDRDANDSSMLIITYDGHHNHPSP